MVARRSPRLCLKYTPSRRHVRSQTEHSRLADYCRPFVDTSTRGEQQKHTTATLDQEHALVAAHGIVDACATRNWQVVRAALMWNHVHVIVKQCPDNGPEVRRILKGVGQNAICKHDGKSRRWWTEKGSDRYLHGERAVLAAAQYVANQPHPLAEIVDMQVIGAASGGVYPR